MSKKPQKKYFSSPIVENISNNKKNLKTESTLQPKVDSYQRERLSHNNNLQTEHGKYSTGENTS